MNIAERLLSIYDKLTTNGWPQDKEMGSIWAEIFEISHTSQHAEDDVVTCLQAMRTEIALLRSKLLSMGVPEDLMHPLLPRLRNATSTVNLKTHWINLREEAMKPENRIALAWAVWTLREEDEEDMSADELAGLRAELDSLQESLKGADMTPYLRGFVQRQIDIIRAALRVYSVHGVKPLEEALQQVAGTYITEKARVEAEYTKASEPARTVFGRAGALIKDIADVADRLDKIRKAGEGAYTLAASVGPMLLTWGHALQK